MDFPRRDELLEAGLRELTTHPGSRITPDVARREGTDANALIAVGAAMTDEVVGQLIEVEAGQFLDSCRGKRLDQRLWDDYRLKRPGATPSQSSIRFRTTAAAAAPFSLPKGITVQTSTGIQFVTTQPDAYPINVTAGPVVPVRSTLAGKSQRALAGPVSIISQITGAPGDLRAELVAATSGGDDEMSDDEFREIGRQFYVNAQLGTLAAIEARAKRVPGVVTARTFEVLSSTGRPERFVLLVIGDRYTDQFADVDAVPPAYAQQSQLLAATVQSALRDTRGAGMGVEVIVGQVVLQYVRLDLRFTAGVNYDAVAYQARLAAFNYTNGLRPGQRWVYSDATAAIRRVAGIAPESAITSPVGDVVAKPLQILRTDMRLVTAGSVASDQPLITSVNPDAYVFGA